jgi:hypothetical protein
MFTSPNENITWTIHRIRTNFIDDLGNFRSGVGTGFWLLSQNDKNIFVTNKHNLDASMLFGTNTEYSLNKIEIELRQWKNGMPQKTSTFFEVINFESVYKSESADCAILFEPLLESHNSAEFLIGSIIKYKDLVQESDFQIGQIKIMESAIFIGYPGKNGINWWDEQWKLPVARQCTLASWPGIPFTNLSIKSTDVLLVSGLSFSGSSGSPVFVYNRGVPPGGDIVDGNWRSSKLVGIMAGHFWEECDVPQMFVHSGLSYLTRSTAIIEIIKRAQQN